MPPAAPVTTKTLSISEGHAGLAVGRRQLAEVHAEAQAVVVAHLDHTGVIQGLGDQRLGRVGGLPPELEVYRLHRDLQALALEGLGDARDAAAQRRAGPLVAVAVQAAQAGGRDEEVLRASELARRACAGSGRGSSPARGWPRGSWPGPYRPARAPRPGRAASRRPGSAPRPASRPAGRPAPRSSAARRWSGRPRRASGAGPPGPCRRRRGPSSPPPGWPASRLAPVGLHRSSGGRSTGIGTRRGARSASATS